MRKEERKGNDEERMRERGKYNVDVYEKGRQKRKGLEKNKRERNRTRDGE
jgi:hypothetical protein